MSTASVCGLVNIINGCVALRQTLVVPLIAAVGKGLMVTAAMFELAAAQLPFCTTARKYLAAVRVPGESVVFEFSMSVKDEKLGVKELCHLTTLPVLPVSVKS